MAGPAVHTEQDKAGGHDSIVQADSKRGAEKESFQARKKWKLIAEWQETVS